MYRNLQVKKEMFFYETMVYLTISFLKTNLTDRRTNFFLLAKLFQAQTKLLKFTLCALKK